MGDDDDRVVLLQLKDQFLDLAGGDGIERRARLVHQDDRGIHRGGAGDAQALLLAAGKSVGALVQTVLHLVPQRRAAQGFLDDAVEHVLALFPENPRAVGDVFVNAARKRIGFLEHHADPPAEFHAVHLRAVDLDAIDPDAAARDPGAGDEVVHPVEAAQQGGLAAAGRADEGGDLVALDVHVDVLQRGGLAIAEIHVLHLDGGNSGSGGG